MSSENEFELYPAVGKLRRSLEKTQDDLDSIRRINQASLKTMTIAAQVLEMISSTSGIAPQVAEMLSQILEMMRSDLHDVFFASRPALPDPDDDFILELAIAPIVDILSRIMPAIFADQRNGKPWLSRRLSSSNLLRNSHAHRNHTNA